MSARPPGTPACEREDAALFTSPVEDLRVARDMLAVCASCDDAIRLWCYETVAPARSRFDGVAGGALWRNGKQITIAKLLTG